MLSGRGSGAVGPEVIAVTAGAVASIFLLKYLLVRSERPPSSTASIGDDEGCKKPRDSMFLLKRGARAGNSAAAEEAVDSSYGLVDRSTGEGIRLVSGPRRVIGLQNLGNTCYVNALLQALSCITEFYDWMEHSSRLICVPVEKHRRPPPSAAETPVVFKRPRRLQELRSATFFHTLCDVLNVVNSRGHSDGNYYAATGLVRIMFSGMSVRLQHCQQDPDELFLFVMSLLTTATAGPFYSCQQGNRGDHAAISAAGPHLEQIPLLTREMPRLSMPFRGLLHQDLYCVICKRSRAQPLEEFFSLSLTLPGYTDGTKQIHTVEDLLSKHFTPADLDSVDCPTCASCSANGQERVRTPHLKRISVAKSPAVLVLHIRRTVWGVDDAWKRSDAVSFPSTLLTGKYSWLKYLGGNNKDVTSGKHTEIFPLKNFADPNNPLGSHCGIYGLRSVIVHVGLSSGHGHIVAYRKGPVHSANAEQWYFTSDQLVRPASWPEVASSNPYMLLYEQIHGPTK